MTVFQVLIWAGALLTLAGLGLLALLIRHALRLRRAPEAEARAALARLLPLNFGALALSALGLLLVVAGILLG